MVDNISQDLYFIRFVWIMAFDDVSMVKSFSAPVCSSTGTRNLVATKRYNLTVLVESGSPDLAR